MSFMFKGPAALTGASTAVGLAATGAVSVGTELSVAGAATLSSTLGVSGTSTLAAVNASGTLTMSGNTNIVVSGGGTISGLPDVAVNNSDAASKKYVDDKVLAGGGGEGLVEPAATAISNIIDPVDVSGKNLYLIQADLHVGNTTMTMDLNTGRNVTGGDTWTIVWASPQTGGTTAGIKVDLGQDKLYDANGGLNRYITLPNVGSSVRLVWHGSNVWHIIGGSGCVPSTS
jgi:hypothetical protein